MDRVDWRAAIVNTSHNPIKREWVSVENGFLKNLDGPKIQERF